MPVTLNLKKVIDLPVFQWLRFTPATAAAGACCSSDKRGTDRYIYHLLGASAFWRYDCWTDTFQQLASPPAFSFAAGVSLTFDPSRNRIWMFAPLTSSPYAMFAYYDIATNAWTSRSAPTGLGAAWGTDAHIAHPCTSYHASGDDDIIYLIGNNSTTWYKYSVAGNSWTTMTPALPAAAGAGCGMVWLFGGDTDKIWFMRGANTATFWLFSKAGNSFTTPIVVPATETFTTGSGFAYSPDENRVYLSRDATHRMFYHDLATHQIVPAGTWPYTSGTAHVGDGLAWVKSPDGAQYLYFRRQGGQEYWRHLIGWF